MATSGTYSVSFDNGDFISEAFERINIDPDSITGRKINSALRSLNLLLSDWETKGVKQYKVENLIYDANTGFPSGTFSVSLPNRVIRVMHVIHTREGADTPLYETTRQEYQFLNKKFTLSTRPDRWWLDREIENPLLVLWPVINDNLNSITVTVFSSTQDAGTLSNSPEIPRIWREALASGLAARLAEKYAPALLEQKVTIAEARFRAARAEDRETGPVTFKVDYSKRRK